MGSQLPRYLCQKGKHYKNRSDYPVVQQQKSKVKWCDYIHVETL